MFKLPEEIMDKVRKKEKNTKMLDFSFFSPEPIPTNISKLLIKNKLIEYDRPNAFWSLMPLSEVRGKPFLKKQLDGMIANFKKEFCNYTLQDKDNVIVWLLNFPNLNDNFKVGSENYLVAFAIGHKLDTHITISAVWNHPYARGAQSVSSLLYYLMMETIITIEPPFGKATSKILEKIWKELPEERKIFLYKSLHGNKEKDMESVDFSKYEEKTKEMVVNLLYALPKKMQTQKMADDCAVLLSDPKTLEELKKVYADGELSEEETTEITRNLINNKILLDGLECD